MSGEYTHKGEVKAAYKKWVLRGQCYPTRQGLNAGYRAGKKAERRALTNSAEGG